jgi:hypothetical protein
MVAGRSRTQCYVYFDYDMTHHQEIHVSSAVNIQKFPLALHIDKERMCYLLDRAQASQHRVHNALYQACTEFLKKFAPLR